MTARAVAPAEPGHGPPPGSPARRRLLLLLALAALLAHLGWAPGEPGTVLGASTLNYDDPQVLAAARGSRVADLFTGITYYAYKPLYFLSLKLDLLLDGDGAGLTHAVNLLLFLGCVVLLARLLLDLTGSAFVAGAAALLFAVHPVHVESVAWVSGRKDVLSLLLVLAAHLSYRSARAAGRVPLLAALLLALGGLSKGTVWTWAGLFALDELLERRRGGPPGAWRRLLPSLLVAAGGVTLDLIVGLRYGPGAVEHGVGTASLAAAVSGVHASYLARLLVPLSLSLDYAVDPAGSWAAPGAWAGLLLAAGALGLLLHGLRRGRALPVLAAGLWILCLLPVNNLWPRTSTLMADRYLLGAAVGPYLLLGALLARLPSGRGLALGLAAVLLGASSVARTRAFFDSQRAWADAQAARPGSALAWIQGGLDAAMRGAHVAALGDADRALALAPRDELRVKALLLRCGALLGLSRSEELLREAGEAGALARALTARLPEARAAEGRAVEAEAEVFRGQALEARGDDALARLAYERAAQLDDRSAVAHYNLGSLLARPEAAERGYERALRHLRLARSLAREGRPELALTADLQYATVLALAGHPDDALRLLDEAEREHGRAGELLIARAQQRLAAGQARRALEDLEALRREHPEHPRAARLVYDLYVEDGQRLLKEGRRQREGSVLARALARFDEATRLEPDWPEAWLGAGDSLYEQARLTDARERYRRAVAAAPKAAWMRSLVVRATVLEAAFTARHAREASLRRVAARGMADALAEGTERIDLGLAPLEAELPSLRAVAGTFARGQAPADAWAEGVLVAAAFLAVGDDARAQAELVRVLAERPQEHGAPEVLEAALFLRAGIYERASSPESYREARNDYALLATLRPEDPTPRLRSLNVELRTAVSRREIARGWYPGEERVKAAAERVAAVKARPADAPALTPGGLAAYEEAEATLRDARRLTEAEAALAEVTARVVAFADAEPGSAEAGLVAVQAEMLRQGWIPALKRLNALRERFPGNLNVLRGQAAVYVNQYPVTQDRMLIQEALNALQQAASLDPRDPRTALDASQARRVAGDLQGALALAQRAATYENLPGGPAAVALAGLTVALGEKALDGGDEKGARQAVEAARRIDPGGAASFVLEARVLLERGRRANEALVPAMRAKELEPANVAVDRLLSRIFYQRGLAGTLGVHALRDPVEPARRDPAAWAALDEAGRAAALRAHEEQRAAVGARREAARARAIQDLESALRHDPDAEHATEARAKLAGLRRSDPDELRRRTQERDRHYLEGKVLLPEGRLVEAYEAFERALAEDPGHGPSCYYLVETAYRRLAGAPLSDEARRTLTNRSYECLQTLDSLDPLDRFPERHLYRGLLNEYLFRRDGQEDARRAALKALRRYVALRQGKAAPDDESLATARARLADLEQAGR